MTATAADIIPVAKLLIAPITDEERSANIAALLPLLDRYATEANRVPRPDLADISDVLLRAHAHATTPASATAWARISPNDFDASMLPALRVFGVGCRLVLAALDSSGAQLSYAKLSLQLAQKATTHRTRLQRYLDYHLEDQPVAKRELDDIRSGTGYLDLESDLRRMSYLVSDNHDLLAADRSFEANDAAVCLTLADAIAGELAAVPSSPTPWVDRLWSAIRNVYANDVRPTAEWLFRKTPSELAHYRSIFVGYGRPKGNSQPELDQPAPTPAVPHES